MVITSTDARLAIAEERIARIAQTLRTFYRAPVTLSALQPVLVLAMELNPDLCQVREKAV